MTGNNHQSWICNAVSVVATAVQPDETLRNVSIILTIIATSVSLAFTIYKWYNKAKADGHITHKEVKGLFKKILHFFKRKGEDE